MFAELFWKECRQTLKSATYYLIILCMLLFYNSQMGDFQMITKPQPGQEDYGWTYSKDEKVIMEQTLETLIREYTGNSYVTYPVGFYKEVKLDYEKQSEMYDIIAELTGLNRETAETAPSVYDSKKAPTLEELHLILSGEMTYEHFKELMKRADKLLGGGSNYSDTYLQNNAQVPKTYEEALQEYNEIIEKDRLSGAYARLFSDYMGIILTILPVFLAVTRGLRDRRARASQVIYVRRASSFAIIMSRYLSLVIMILLPVILIAAGVTVPCLYSAAKAGISVDSLAFIKYTLGWLLPSIMISVSVGVFFTELTENAIAILVQGVWWFVSLFMGIINIMGGYGFNLIPRHNTLGNYEVYHDNFNILAANRITYALIAILLTIAAVLIYDRKRRGKLMIHGKISSTRKSKSEA